MQELVRSLEDQIDEVTEAAAQFGAADRQESKENGEVGVMISYGHSHFYGYAFWHAGYWRPEREDTVRTVPCNTPEEAIVELKKLLT